MQALIRILSILVAILLLTMGVSFLIPGSDQPTSRPDPRFESLLQGTSNLSEQPGTVVVGTVMALVIVAILATFILIGLHRQGGIGWLGRCLMGGFLVYGGLFVMVIFTDTAPGQDVSFLGGFPTATAWMVYGIWLFPLVFVFLYMLGFESAVLSPQDLKRFRAIQKEHSPQERSDP